MKDTTVAVMGGALGALGVSLVLYGIKAAEIKEVVVQSQSETPSHALAQRIATMQSELTAFATDYTTTLAEQSAKEHLFNRLGITERQQGLLERVSSIFSGGSGSSS